MARISQSIQAKGVLIAIKSKLWFATVKVASSKLKNLPDEVRGMQDLLSDKSSLKDIHKQYQAIKAYIRSETLPFPIDGFNFVSEERIELIDNRLQEMKKDFDDSVKVFARKYKSLIAKTRESLEKQSKKKNFNFSDFFDEGKFPDDISSRFAISWDFLELSLPGERLQSVSKSFYQKKKREYETLWQECLDLTMDTARQAMLEKIQRIQESCLAEKFDQRSVSALENALQKWSDLWSDFIGQRELRMVVSQLKREVKGMSADRLRNNEAYRGEVEKSFKGLADSLIRIDPNKKKRSLRF